MGNAGIPVADSVRYLAKLIQYCKVLKKKKKNHRWLRNLKDRKYTNMSSRRKKT